MGQIQWITSLVMIALFAFAIIGFAINFAIDNDAPVNINDDSQITGLYDDINTSTSTFSSGANQTMHSILNSTIESGDETTESGGQFKVNPVTALGAVEKVFRVGYIKIFGSGSGFGVFMTAFFAMLIFISGLLLWKTWAGKNPE